MAIHTMRAGAMSAVLLAAAAVQGPAFAGDEMSGLYKRPNGNLVMVASCGKDYCVTAQTAPYKGRSVGQFRPAGGSSFTGKITDLKSGKTYSGKANFDGKSLTVAGCVMGGLVCKSESWLKQ